jgi:hypothetical protein
MREFRKKRRSAVAFHFKDVNNFLLAISVVYRFVLNA